MHVGADSLKDLIISCINEHLDNNQYYLTEVAGEGGPDLAPQKFLLSQKLSTTISQSFVKIGSKTKDFYH